MAKGKQSIPQDLQRWIDVRRRYHLTHALVQMARELGMNPRKMGGIANQDQEPWKAPLPIFIEDLYEKRFGRPRPERVISVEKRARELAAKKAAQKAAKLERRQAILASDSPEIEPSEGAEAVGVAEAPGSLDRSGIHGNVPSSAPAARRTRRTKIFIDDDQRRALKQLAGEERQSHDVLLRLAVDEFLARCFKGRADWGEGYDALVQRIQSRILADEPAIADSYNRVYGPGGEVARVDPILRELSVRTLPNDQW